MENAKLVLMTAKKSCGINKNSTGKRRISEKNIWEKVQVTVGDGAPQKAHTPIQALRGRNVTLPCAHKWDLKKDYTKNLAHATWYLKDANDTDEEIASHDCQTNPASCEIRRPKSRTFFDLDFDNGTANLIIADVRSSDSGLYFCVVVTMDGIIQQSFALSVSGTDTSIRIESSAGMPSPLNPSELIVRANTEETLTCSAYLPKGSAGTIFWESEEGISLKPGNQTNVSTINEEYYVTSWVTFNSTDAVDNKWVECGIKENGKSPRRVNLKVKNVTEVEKRATFGPPILINNGTIPFCFHRGSSDQLIDNKTCCQADNIVFSQNMLSNGYIGILCCTKHECRPINFKITEGNSIPPKDALKGSGHNLATIMAISLYVVIGSGIMVIAAVFIWRKRKAFKCHKDEEHTYCEPPAVPARIASLPPPPLSWIEYEQQDDSCMSSFDDYSFGRDDELQELSTTYSDLAPAAHRSLSRTISTLSRRGLRDSEVVYVNFPIRNVLSRIKKIGWSYF